MQKSFNVGQKQTVSWGIFGGWICWTSNFNFKTWVFPRSLENTEFQTQPECVPGFGVSWNGNRRQTATEFSKGKTDNSEQVLA